MLFTDDMVILYASISEFLCFYYNVKVYPGIAVCCET